MKKTVRFLAALLVMVSVFFAPVGALRAQDGDDANTEEVEETGGPGLWDILYGGSIVTLGIWLAIGGTSFSMVWLVADGVVTVKREKIMPDSLVEGVRESLTSGDLENALVACETNPSPLANILMAGFGNITEGYDVIQEAVTKTTEMETEKLIQRISYLNLCGQLAPMLGLLGTVTGMVGAFSTLGASSGGANAKLLAANISVALWTTAVGLIISIPALLAYTFLKNYATRMLIETETIVLDLIKVLRNAEVE
jgi:biopolymer transport protein ExbB